MTTVDIGRVSAEEEVIRRISRRLQDLWKDNQEAYWALVRAVRDNENLLVASSSVRKAVMAEPKLVYEHTGRPLPVVEAILIDSLKRGLPSK